MNEPRGNPDRASRRPRLVAAFSVLAAAFFVGVAPVVGDGLNQKPVPNSPVTPATVAASVAQTSSARVAGTGDTAARISAGKKDKKRVVRRVQLKSRITEEPVVTGENKGTFVGVQCPKGYKAVSGGVLSGFINLLVSSSSPNNPLSGKYTPRTWWLTVTNANIDGQGGSLAWRGVVNCLSPVRIRK